MGAYSVLKGKDLYAAFQGQHMPFSYYYAVPLAVCGARTVYQFRLGTYLMLALVWELAQRLQSGLDGQKRAGPLACKRLRSPIGQKAALRKMQHASRFAARMPGWERLFRGNAGSLASLAARFAGLEILSPEWREGLEALRGANGTRCAPQQEVSPRADAVYARYLWCSLYKYWLDAADDGRLLSRVRRSFDMTLLGRAMDQLVPKDRSWLQRISREIEHCEENLEALLN